MKTIKAEEIPVEETARHFLQSLDLTQGEVVLESNGKPCLVMVPPQILEQRRRAKEQLFALIEQIHKRNPSGSADDLLRDLEEIDHPERFTP